MHVIIMGWSDDFNLELALNLNELSHDWSADLGSKYQIYQKFTMKPVLSGHPWDMHWCPLNTGCSL